jgi:L-fucose mutarotase/ribose pyranase (RbsD/FucU family)
LQELSLLLASMGSSDDCVVFDSYYVSAFQATQVQQLQRQQAGQEQQEQQ